MYHTSRYVIISTVSWIKWQALGLPAGNESSIHSSNNQGARDSYYIVFLLKWDLTLPDLKGIIDYLLGPWMETCLEEYQAFSGKLVKYYYYYRWPSKPCFIKLLDVIWDTGGFFRQWIKWSSNLIKLNWWLGEIRCETRQPDSTANQANNMTMWQPHYSILHHQTSY